jgi:uncharacterized protein
MANWGRILSRGNVEDRRSMVPVAAGGISLTGLALLLLFNVLSGGDLGDVLSQVDTQPVQDYQQLDKSAFEGEDSYEIFASKVLGSNNDLWTQKFKEQNVTYTPPKLVLFRQATDSNCGTATSSIGPHYCPLDRTIYLDETFFDELTNRLGAQGGDVAEAYVISHEVGHHAQNELGIMNQAGTLTGGESNTTSVKLELQADCFAGMWLNSIKHLDVLEPGEVYEAMNAAESVGDDRIQKRTQGYVNQEEWTHGSAKDRVTWFNKGYQSGSLAECDTFP